MCISFTQLFLGSGICTSQVLTEHTPPIQSFIAPQLYQDPSWDESCSLLLIIRGISSQWKLKVRPPVQLVNGREPVLFIRMVSLHATILCGGWMLCVYAKTHELMLKSYMHSYYFFRPFKLRAPQAGSGKGFFHLGQTKQTQANR